ncbi:MAG: hypothetical protein AB1644_07760 [Candidatus Zixiibacteriota bacterium]
MIRFWITIALCAAAVAVSAQDNWRSDTSLRVIPQLEPKNQLAVGIGFPIDEVKSTVQVAAQYFRYLADIFALKAELGYVPNTSYDRGAHASTVSLGVGFRLQMPTRIIGMFLDGSVETSSIFAVERGREFRASRTGVGLALGWSAGPVKRYRLDFGISGSLNHVGYTYHVDMIPESGPSYDMPSTDNSSDLYNRAYWFVRLRRGI